VVPIPAMPAGGASVVSSELPGRGPCTAEAGQDGCDGQPDGCTGLHFLDGSIFEECCNTHDKCFERYWEKGDCCEAWSWFFPNPFWRCARCNFSVVRCFATAGEGRWEEVWPTRCAPRDSCERCNVTDWCDISCMNCRTRNDVGR
jgi:hypothetical protein